MGRTAEAVRRSFGIASPLSVTEIKYHDHYVRGLMDGGYEQWMRITATNDVLSKIVTKNGYSRVTNVNYTLILNGGARPAWWPPIDTGKIVLYTKSNEENPRREGFSFRAFLWRDEDSKFIYYLQTHWN